MSNSIDTRIVEMKFDSDAFQRGIAGTLRSLDALKKGTEFKGAAAGFDNLNKAASRINLSHISDGVQSIAGRMTNLGIVGVTALASIAHQAIATGAQLVKSITTDPISDGLKEYETNLNSIQTILANTGLEGKSGLGQVTGALDELNHYSDKTIYNFSEMARNIGTFTAAGVKLEPATAAIKGIANLAAISGSNAEQASTAMYQLSQAMAAGKATLVDWNSVVNAGMGGKVFQEALKETARVQGVNIDAIIKQNGSFRDSLQEGWLTTSVLSDTLAKFTGDLSAAQLKAMGYNDKQIAGIIKMGKTAQDAATKVKTVSQLIGTLQEAVGSGWSKTFQTLFGDFDEARDLFTNVNNVLGGFIQTSADARNKVLTDWKALGGRKVLIESISLAFNNLMEVITPIKKAFRDIFPPTTGKQLYELTVALRDFLSGARLGEDTMENLRRTFRGFFAIFDIGFQVLKGLGRVIAAVFKEFSGGSGGILEFTGNIGDWLVALDKAIKSGSGFMKFFDGLAKVITTPIRLIKQFIEYLKDVSSTVDEVASVGAGRIAERFRPLGAVGELISKAWDGIGKTIKTVVKAFAPLVDKFQNFFSELGASIENSFGDVNYGTILDSINTGLLAALTGLFALFYKNGLKVNVGGGLIESISGAFDGLTGTMKAMQAQLKAGTLLKIASAIALLTVSVVALSLIDPKKLASALSALTIMFVQMLAAMAIVEKIAASGGFLKLPFITGAMILLAVAIDVLTIAVAKMAKLDWNDLAKGLTGVLVLIAAISGSAKLISGSGKGMIATGLGMILLATGVQILADAVQKMSGLSWEEMAKGLVGVGTILGALALFTKFAAVDKGGVLQGAGLILLAVAIKIMADAVEDLSKLSWKEIARGLVAMGGGLAIMATAIGLIPPSSIINAAGIFIVAQALSTIGDAVKQMGQLKWDEIARGLTTMAGALGIIALAIGLLPPSSLLSAAAVFVVASSLGMISEALSSMGGQSWTEIAKGLVTLAGALGIIAAAMYVMQGALPGAAALIVVAGSLRLIAPVLQAFGDMSLGEIGKSLLLLAGVFAVLGVAGLVLAPLVPVLIGLGVAITLMGVGMLAAGAGLLLFSTALAALAVSGAAATAVLFAAVKKLAELLPIVVTQIGLALIAAANAIIKAGPPLVKALTVVLMALLDAIVKLTPKLMSTMGVLLEALLKFIVKYAPKIVQAGLTLILALIQGLSKNIAGITKAAVDLMVKFIQSVSAQQQKLLDAGAKLIVSFVNSLATTIENNSGPLRDAGGRLAVAIIDGMTGGMASGVQKLAGQAASMAQSALKAAKDALGIKSPSKEFIKVGQYVVAGFVKGLDGDKAAQGAVFNSMREQVVSLMNDSAKQAEVLTAKLKKLQSARVKDIKAINQTKDELARANSEMVRAQRTFNLMRGPQQAQLKSLNALADQYDVYTGKIKAAEDALNSAIKVRDDFNKALQDQYGELPQITADTKVTDYFQSLKDQTANLQTFSTELQKLRLRGLNDEAYQELLKRGPEVLPFIRELLTGGQTGVNEFNKLTSSLNAAAASLGDTASKQLYQAGIQAAAGFVNGLKVQQASIEKQMDIIAAKMVAAIKKALGIKSPSRVFAEIGRYSMEGMSVGLDKYSVIVSKSAENVGKDAIDRLRTTMAGISDVVVTDDRFNPIIRPVLDLTDVQKNAALISNILAAKPLTVDVTSGQAKNASTAYFQNRLAQQEQTADSASSDVTFIQNNTSPKALSAADLYRQTNNQLSVAKGALKDAK